MPPPLTAAALRVLHARYLRRDERGEICETPEQLFERVADAVAQAEPPGERARWAAEFLEVMRGLHRGRLGLVPEAPDALKALFTTALEIPANRQLRIQAAFQRHVDNSVSKTIQLTPEATSEDIMRIYQRAFELGLKGITVFRHGSRPTQVVELGLGEEPYQQEHAAKCDPDECNL